MLFLFSRFYFFYDSYTYDLGAGPYEFFKSAQQGYQKKIFRIKIIPFLTIHIVDFEMAVVLLSLLKNDRQKIFILHTFMAIIQNILYLY